MDVGGADAAQKLSILLALGFGAEVQYTDILTEGLDCVDAKTSSMRRNLDTRSRASRLDGAMATMWKHESILPSSRRGHSWRSTASTAVLTESHAMGTSLFYGKGAGMLPTAMSVVSDLVEVGRNLLGGVTGRLPHLAFHEGLREPLRLKPHGDIICSNYLRFTVRDEPGVVASIATVLGEHGINISQMLQPNAAEGEEVDLVILTHQAKENDLGLAIAAIQEFNAILAPTRRIRIEPTL